jgi:predicted RNase H-like nuclease
MTTLLVGFDSAWTGTNSGALVAVLYSRNGTFHDLGPPKTVDYPRAEASILEWQAQYTPTATVVLLDQPTIVKNAEGQRPVENIVASSISLRYGGMQPANTSKRAMFGTEALIWPFLSRFGGPADPFEPITATRVFETYPALALIALRWTLADLRPAGRLPKYNPERRKTFAISDWRHVCGRAAEAFREKGLTEVVQWLDSAALMAAPRKRDQDGLDACLCLIVALYVAERKECLVVGDQWTGYIVVPHCPSLAAELQCRCNSTGRVPPEWVRVFRASEDRATAQATRLG